MGTVFWPPCITGDNLFYSSPDAVCEDSNADMCFLMSDYCDDAQVQWGCPKTCGVCGSGGLRASMGASMCKDSAPSNVCMSFLSKGWCESKTFLKEKVCRKTCGACRGGSCIILNCLRCLNSEAHNSEK